jgi:hypothetical protein
MVPREMVITNPDGTTSPIKQVKVTSSKKTLGIHDSSSRGNSTHLAFIKEKVNVWVSRMVNGHLPNHMAWVAYRHQLWPGVRYGLGTMTNDLEVTDNLLHKEDYRMLNILGVVRSITKGLWHLHTSFGGFGLFDLTVEQLICRVNMLMQHYHTPTNLSRKLDTSLQYLQLQLGTPPNPFLLDYSVWGHLAPILWVMMLWQTLHHFDIHLYMAYPNIALPRERDQVITGIFLSMDLSPDAIRGLNRCRVSLESIFLSDLTTADGRYLEDYVFNPGGRGRSFKYKFPREQPTRGDWNQWFDFWHSFATTGDRLKVPLENWTNPTHCIWKWYYREGTNDIQRVEGDTMFFYKPASGFRFTQATRTYHAIHEVPLSPSTICGMPISVTGSFAQQVVKLSVGPPLAKESDTRTEFWELLYSWGGAWMWEVIEVKGTPADISWILDGLKNGSLIWVTDRSYDRKKAKDLCGVGWMIFCTNSGFHLTSTFWERSCSASLYRAELLGFCVLHLLAQALAEFYKVAGWSATLCCDNKHALEVSSHHMRRI